MERTAPIRRRGGRRGMRRGRALSIYDAVYADAYKGSDGGGIDESNRCIGR